MISRKRMEGDGRR
jgi:hypothetical protein